jgi:hypothetical protein
MMMVMMMMVKVVMVVVIKMVVVVMMMELRHLNWRGLGCRLCLLRRQNLRGVGNWIEQFAE